MADFCKTCAIRVWGFDTKDLAGLTEPDGEPVLVLCEGCGYVRVNSAGERVELPTIPLLTSLPEA